MERTRSRPLAAGTVTPSQAVGEATAFLTRMVPLIQHTRVQLSCTCYALLLPVHDAVAQAACGLAAQGPPKLATWAPTLPCRLPPACPAAFLGAQLSAGLAILLQLNPYSQVGAAHLMADCCQWCSSGGRLFHHSHSASSLQAR